MNSVTPDALDIDQSAEVRDSNEIDCGAPKVHGVIFWSFDLAGSGFSAGIRPSGSIFRYSPRSMLKAMVLSSAKRCLISPVGPKQGSRAARAY